MPIGFLNLHRPFESKELELKLGKRDYRTLSGPQPTFFFFNLLRTLERKESPNEISPYWIGKRGRVAELPFHLVLIRLGL